MPTPLGHAITGLAIYTLGSEKNSFPSVDKNYGLIVVCVLASWAPDLDFIYWSENGITLSGLYHHGITHSIGFAIIVGVLTSAIAFVINSPLYLKAGVLASVSYSAHVLLDLLGHDTYAVNGIGVPALWPITGEYFVFSVMPPTNRLEPFSPETIFGVGAELLLTGALLLGAIAWRQAKGRKTNI